MSEFCLINMNGRVYDPVLGQFVQPDNFIQFPESAKSYNSVAYALNNPLMYTDPSGEFIATALSIVSYAYTAYTAYNITTALWNGDLGGAFKQAVVFAACYSAVDAINHSLGFSNIDPSSLTAVESCGMNFASAAIKETYMSTYSGGLTKYSIANMFLFAALDFAMQELQAMENPGNNFEQDTELPKEGYQKVKLGKATPLGYDSDGEPIFDDKEGHRIVEWNTECYNCHSKAWNNGQGDPTDVANEYLKRLLPKWDNSAVNNTEAPGVAMLLQNAKVQTGDRIVYYSSTDQNFSNPLHSGIVTAVNSQGQANQIMSKWGPGPLWKHHPRDVPSDYGTIRKYFRIIK